MRFLEQLDGHLEPHVIWDNGWYGQPGGRPHYSAMFLERTTS